jgi:hypothetical protein
MLTLLGASGASIAVAVASPSNILFADFIDPHGYLLKTHHASNKPTVGGHIVFLLSI